LYSRVEKVSAGGPAKVSRSRPGRAGKAREGRSGRRNALIDARVLTSERCRGSAAKGFLRRLAATAAGEGPLRGVAASRSTSVKGPAAHSCCATTLLAARERQTRSHGSKWKRKSESLSNADDADSRALEGTTGSSYAQFVGWRMYSVCVGTEKRAWTRPNKQCATASYGHKRRRRGEGPESAQVTRFLGS